MRSGVINAILGMPTKSQNGWISKTTIGPLTNMAQRSLVLLPGESLKDLPTHIPDDEADAFFASWVAPWNPLLLNAAKRLPTWTQAADPAENPQDVVVFAAPWVLELAPSNWVDEVRAMGRLCEPSRSDAAVGSIADADRLVQLLSEGQFNAASSETWERWAKDFAALGLCYLLVEMLTRRMRYISNIDWVRLERQTLAAAAAVVSGDETAVQSELRGAFEALAQAKDQFYPAMAYLCDLVLTASTTLGVSLNKQLERPHSFSIIASGEVIEQLAANHPENLARLRERIHANQITLVGGPDSDVELPLLPLDALIRCLQRGRDIYLRRLEIAPRYFGSRRYVLTPVLPQCLERLGYRAVYHNACDDGVFPLASQCLSRWQGLGPGSLQALFRPPQDGQLAGTILCFAENLGHTMDVDHVATLGFAHWPNRTTPWLDLILRSQRYCEPMGSFVHLERYFREAEVHGYSNQFLPDAYEEPYLEQDVEKGHPRPISRWARYYQALARIDAINALNVWSEQLSGRPMNAPAVERGEENSTRADALLLGSGKKESNFETFAPSSNGLQSLLDKELLEAAAHLTRLVTPSGPTQGNHLVNTASINCLNTPAFGYRFRPRSGVAAPLHYALDEDGALLVSQSLKVRISRETGGVVSVERPGKRGNFFSQHLALRDPKYGADEAAYIRGACEDLQVEHRAEDGVLAAIARGVVRTPENVCLARYQQTTLLRAESSLLELQFDIELAQPLAGKPWSNYCASRVAWSDGSAELRRGVAGYSHVTALDRLLAPEFIEVLGSGERLAILTGGLPYHVLRDTRKLDTLLAVRGETESKGLQQALAIGSESAASMAKAWLVPTLAIPCAAPNVHAGWFFHVDCPSVIVARWESVYIDDQVVGCRVFLQNTMNSAASGVFRTLKPIRSAVELDLTGETAADVEISNAGMHFHLAGYEFGRFEMLWR